MTPANVTAVRAFFEAVNRGALDDAIAPLDPEVEFDWTRSRSPERGVYRGREEVKRLYERFIESWTECEFFESEILESGDAVVRVGGFHGRGKGSGVETRASAAIVWSFRGGRAISAGMYQSRAEALEAISPVPEGTGADFND
jgi:ketosteroid isomerase-like protein